MPRKRSSGSCLDPSAEAMLAEHERVAALYLYNADIGEKRVSLYMTLVSGGTAVFLGLAQFGVDRGLLWWSAFAFLAMVVLVGTLTFERLIERRIRSTQCLRAINRIHSYFVRHDADLSQYYSWPPHDNVPSFSGRAGLLAGLRDVVAVLNSLFTGAMLAALSFALGIHVHSLLNITIGAVGAVIAWFVQQRHEAEKLAQAEEAFARLVRFPSSGTP